MNAILVCVDYHDLLGLMLPWNRHHFDRVMIVTSPADTVTALLAETYGCELTVTDAFYRRGAKFNKFAALEEGLDGLGREGWIAVMDADVLWPKVVPVSWRPEKGTLYTPRRRMMETIPTEVPSEDLWPRFPLHPQQREFAGYTQIFHASDPVLGPAPWHEIDWAHAGGGDSLFQVKWPEAKKVRPPFEVLHLGPAGVNWCGRASAYADGTVPAEAGQRREQVRAFVRGRVPGPDRFRGEKLPG